MIPHKQLSLADIFQNCQNDFHNDKYQFLELLEQTIDLDEIVPVSFPLHFHARTGRPRRHQLYPMLWALLLQRIFSIPTDSLLILFLKYSQELRDFCGFDVVPDASRFTRFKQEKAFIPLNGRLSSVNSDCPLNEDGVPCCPKAPSLPMKREGSRSHLRCGIPTMKFVCPKMKWKYDKTTKKSGYPH